MQSVNLAADVSELEKVVQMITVFEHMHKAPDTSGALCRLHRARDKLVRRIMAWYFFEATPGYIEEIARLRKEYGA